HLPLQLLAIGCRMKAGGKERSRFEFSNAEIAHLAKIEYRRRVTEELLSSWKAETSIEHLRQSTSVLSSWETLQDNERMELELRASRIPGIVATLGKDIERLDHS
ncbi:MAG TPA: hypothetical protein PKM25_15070, partial [Candidatus Ozemobacteraceae bacterium]|nr:hypothetical protein [Candidatus Ozemobacteraceae bacterium]